MLASKHIAALAPGTVINGKYRVEHPLGTGGMGVVVAARHVELNQTVAIKVLLPSANSNNEEATARFLREGRSAAQLNSPHVAKVHDTGRLPSGEPYLVMELLRGRDLRAHLSEVRRVPLGQAADWILQATHALAEAHALHIVHRDVKAANLFLAETSAGPQIKVLDFGISKQLDAADVDLTNTQSTVGTPRYMAPEQMRSAKFADARADIWSLGIVLYELTTGRTPFHGESVTALCFDVMERTPQPPSEINPELPAAFDAVVARCLMKDPDDRYPSVESLAAALRPFARGSLSSARDSMRLGLFYAPPSQPLGIGVTPQSLPAAPAVGALPVAGATPIPPEPTHATRMDAASATASTRREGTAHPDPTQPPLPAYTLQGTQPLAAEFPARGAAGSSAFGALDQLAAPDLGPQETMRAWDTTAMPRAMAARAQASRVRLIGIGVGIGVLTATLGGILIAFSASTAPAMSPNTSSAPHTAAPSIPPSSPTTSVERAAPPPDPSPRQTVDADPPFPTPSADPSSSSTPVAVAPPPPPAPVKPVKPAPNCIPPTWTDASGRKHVKPECNH